MFEKGEVLNNVPNWQQADFPQRVSHIAKATELAESVFRRNINKERVDGIPQNIRGKALSELAGTIRTRLENQTYQLVGFYEGRYNVFVPDTVHAGSRNDKLDISHEIREGMETIVEGTTNRNYSEHLEIIPYSAENVQSLPVEIKQRLVDLSAGWQHKNFVYNIVPVSIEGSQTPAYAIYAINPFSALPFTSIDDPTALKKPAEYEEATVFVGLMKK